MTPTILVSEKMTHFLNDKLNIITQSTGHPIQYLLASIYPSPIIMFAASGNESEPSSFPITNTLQWSQNFRHFSFDEICSATKHFNDSLEIGRGGFGRVYRCSINNGYTDVVAAIKRLDYMSGQGGSEFWAEVQMLSKLRHCHLVSLIGYCNHQKEMILVYEYMPHGTLSDHLHKDGTRLSWCQRLKICIGAARGLDYLHTGTGIEFGIIHRDVKSSNILLDKSWAAKVSDFGLSKITPRNQPSRSSYVNTEIKGSFGYIDPNYVATGKLTRKSDVYAFGVVLLEVLCRKRAVDGNFVWGIATWAQDSIKVGRLRDIVDSDIRGEISTKCLKRFARIIERCLDNYPENRPTMSEVVLSLEYVLNSQEKTNNLLQNAGKTMFDKIADVFSLGDNDLNSGMEFGTLMPKNPNVGMNFRSLVPKKPNMDTEFRSLMPKKPKVGMNFRSFIPKKRKQPMLMEAAYASIRLFRAKELKKATMNYSECMIIGKGAQGTVYKGRLPDLGVVAIKRAKTLDQTEVEQFINEIVILGQINHKNIVRILGCCLETDVPLIVYEFVSNGSLFEHIHDETSGKRLSWDNRLRIAYESADALAYLHTSAQLPIIHRDVKSSNILLDENYVAKVADFGVSRLLDLSDDHLTTQVQGTLGYLDPEYFHTNRVTHKSDVYSFGVVLAELLTRLKPIDLMRDENSNLAVYFKKAHSENRVHEIVDSRVLEEVTNEQLKAAGYLTCSCLRLNSDDRPSMKEVSMELERIKDLGIHPSIISQDNNDEIRSLISESEQIDLDEECSHDRNRPRIAPAAASSVWWVRLIQLFFILVCKIFLKDLFCTCQDLNSKPLI